jgi:hypothetical protein
MKVLVRLLTQVAQHITRAETPTMAECTLGSTFGPLLVGYQLIGPGNRLRDDQEPASRLGRGKASDKISERRVDRTVQLHAGQMGPMLAKDTFRSKRLLRRAITQMACLYSGAVASNCSAVDI